MKRGREGSRGKKGRINKGCQCEKVVCPHLLFLLTHLPSLPPSFPPSLSPSFLSFPPNTSEKEEVDEVEVEEEEEDEDEEDEEERRKLQLVKISAMNAARTGPTTTKPKVCMSSPSLPPSLPPSLLCAATPALPPSSFSPLIHTL